MDRSAKFAAQYILLFLATSAFAQTTGPAPDADPTVAIASLRADLIDSFNKNDLPRLLSHLDPEVVITWQNGEVCRGPDEVKAYYEKMMDGPNRVVASVHANPQVTGRNIYGNWAVSWGEMNDHFSLTEGSELDMKSKFTATIARRGDAWKVISFHLSVNAFDNAILTTAVKKTAIWTGFGAGIAGLFLGFVGAWLIKRRKAA